jgi:hypothetical protein
VRRPRRRDVGSWNSTVERPAVTAYKSSAMVRVRQAETAQSTAAAVRHGVPASHVAIETVDRAGREAATRFGVGPAGRAAPRSTTRVHRAAGGGADPRSGGRWRAARDPIHRARVPRRPPSPAPRASGEPVS